MSHRILRSVLCLLTLATALSATRAAEPPQQRSFIAADSSRQRVAIVNEDGSTRWEHRIGPLHDLHLLPSGHVLLQLSWTHVAELDPATGKTIWEYDAARRPENQGQRIEIHAFQRLANGTTLVAESGPARLLTLAPDLSIHSSVALKVAKPDAHHDTRLVRALETGNFLVCHEAEGLVREYRQDGSTAWEYTVPLFGRERRPGHGVDAFGNQVFSALRMKNGNTLIGTGNGHSVIEVTPAGQVVWSLHQNELPEIQLAWVTSLQVLPSGNILINNCHAGPNNPQLIEVSREKRVVWSFRDFDRFADALTNSQVLSVNGKPLTNSLR
ncbi:MAG: PQQ-binding-like beta-propeller repeat protein [Planctomycetota bacterium]